MAFTRTILAPKANYTLAEQTFAATVLARWLIEEPRCNKTAAEVLRLRSEGPMLLYQGSGADAGQWVQVSFVRKAGESLKLYAAAAVVPDRATFARLIARAIRDVLTDGAPAVYFHFTDGDDPLFSPWVALLPVLFENLDVAFPGVFVTASRRLPGHQRGLRWEVRLAP